MFSQKLASPSACSVLLLIHRAELHGTSGSQSPHSDKNPSLSRVNLADVEPHFICPIFLIFVHISCPTDGGPVVRAGSHS
ncbi:hypothetical protein IW262DRAFT_28764 [Armillaria fumosa]|nr:hypothetical protein IW262DRAFT_28764 [Armillaria fumosa]